MRKEKLNKLKSRRHWNLRTPKDLSMLLGVPIESLTDLTSVPPERHYRSWTKPKKSGDPRKINEPKRLLMSVQKRINRLLLQRTVLPSQVLGGVPGKQLVDNVKLHVGRPMVANFDIEDFFPHISSNRIYGVFLSIGCSKNVAGVLTSLTTYKGRLPQGAPTSTSLANMVMAQGGNRSLFRRLQGLTESMGCGTVSTWVDDITLSGPGRLPKFKKTIDKIIRQSGFNPKERKTEFLRQGERQTVTGLVVNEKPNVPKEYRRKLREQLHGLRTKGPEAFSDVPARKLKASLRSKIAFVQSVNPQAGQKLLIQFNSIVWPS